MLRMVIRDAELADAALIARIYNEGIEDRIATFETDLRSAEDIEAWFEVGLPFIVLEVECEVVAYAVGVRYSGRCAYAGGFGVLVLCGTECAGARIWVGGFRSVY